MIYLILSQDMMPSWKVGAKTEGLLNAVDKLCISENFGQWTWLEVVPAWFSLKTFYYHHFNHSFIFLSWWHHLQTNILLQCWSQKRLLTDALQSSKSKKVRKIPRKTSVVWQRMLVALLIKKSFTDVTLRIRLNFSNQTFFRTLQDVYLRKAVLLTFLESTLAKNPLKKLKILISFNLSNFQR